MQKVTIIGLGLIGGSLGMALKAWSAQNDDALRIVGYDTDMEHQTLAKRKGAVDETAWGLPNAVEDADIVVLATPVGQMQELFEQIAPHLKFEAIVTDTGSTKAEVLEWAKVLPGHVSFIGGHPMAGRSESIEAASADLFEGATWIVCPSPSASEFAIKNVMGIIAATGAEPYFVEPDEHDAYVAGISHLPFVVAAALVKTTTGGTSWRDMKTIASSGFRDTTRLALGSPDMHRDIAITNRASLTRWIDEMIATLNEVKDDLAHEDIEEARARIGEFFAEAQDSRAHAERVRPRSSEMMTDEEEGARMGGMGATMGRMLFGGLGRRGGDRDARDRRS